MAEYPDEHGLDSIRDRLQAATDSLPLQVKLLTYFAAVVQAQSFQAAAERLGLDKTVLADQTARLERIAGVPLLERAGARAWPTREGLYLYEECADILNATADTFARLARDGAGPNGHLRILAPIDFGVHVVAPALAAYAVRHPKVRAELQLSPRFVELGRKGFDVAFQLAPDGHGRPSRPAGQFEQWLVTSAESARGMAPLSGPQDLRELPWIGHVGLANVEGWQFSHPIHGSCTFHAQPMVTIHCAAAVESCLTAGAGVGVLPHFVAAAGLLDGRLVRLLPEWALPPGEVHAVFSVGRCNRVAAEALVNLITASGAAAAPVR